MPTVIPRVFSARAATVLRHRQIESAPGLTEARVSTADGRPFPLQVDGDYIGEFELAEYSVTPGALTAVS
jgi:diacylglycerol kinase family enzyme